MTSHGTDHSVRIGDYICLFNEKFQGFMYSDDTSVKNNGLQLYRGKTVEGEEQQIPNVHALTFQILTANRYKLTKDYQKLKQKEDEVPERVVASAKAAADAESKDNKSEQERLLGHPVKYGDIVQLRHVFTNKFVVISTKESSKLDKQKMKVSLQESNAKQTQFRVQPRYKVKEEGEQLEIEDMIILESVKSPEHFLHIDIDKTITDLNCATEPSVLQVHRHYTPGTKLENVVRGGSAIQLFHKDIEGYISAEGIFGKEMLENAHLRLRPTDPSNIQSYSSPKNTNTLWQVVLEESQISGAAVKWESTFHLLHMTAKRYLSFTENGEACLLKESGEDTLFQFQPLLHESDKVYVHFEHAIRLYHLKTKGWMNSSEDLPYQRQLSGEEGSLEAIEWDKAKLLQLKVSSHRQYPDVMIVRTVDNDTLHNFYYVGGLFPFVDEIIHKANGENMQQLHGKDIISINQTFDELTSFVTTGSRETATSRRNMLRLTRLTDNLVEILKIPLENKRKLMLAVFKKIYEVFFQLTSSRATANLLYCGRFLPFFQTQMLLSNNVGEQCSLTVIELVKNNRKILDRMQSRQITSIADLAIKYKQPQFFNLLGALCICNDVAITENQTLVAENILTENKAKVYQLEAHKDKKTDKYTLFISGDDGHKWIPLKTFCDENDDSYSVENHTFFRKQLDLYKNLCFGGNKRCMELVTQNEKIFTWELVLVALKDESLPDDIKTNICSVVIETYLESSRTTSILENITNNFVYRNIGQNMDSREGKRSTEDEFPGLKPWLMIIFKQNPTLQEVSPERNAFLLQVIRLVTCLVKYGFIHTEEDLGYFKRCFMHYIRVIKKKSDTEKEDKSILDTKNECLKFMDILFTLQNTRRIQELIVVFKKTLLKEEKPSLTCGMCGNNSTTLLLRKLNAETLWQRKGLQKNISKLIVALCRKSDVFGPDVVDIFFRLTSLGSDTLRRRALRLLNEYYSSVPNVITTAERAMLLLSMDSEKIHLECLTSMPTLRKCANSKIVEDDVSTVCDILQRYSGYCQSQHLSDEIRYIRQNILVNNGVLEVLRKLISQDTDAQLKSLQRISEAVTTHSLALLQQLAQQNTYVKEWIYRNLFDTLSGLTICGPECAAAINEVFSGESQICAKVSPKQIKKIVRICGKYQDKAPGWLFVLKKFLKDETTGLVNARNQLEMMKLLMNFFSTACFPMVKSEQDRLSMLLGERGVDSQTYYIHLVDLVATCAQGKNIYIESTCQKFLSVGEVLRTIIDIEVPLHNRIPFALFLVNVYLNSAKSPLEIGTEEMEHDFKMWELIKMITIMTSNTGSIKKSRPNDEVLFMLEAGFMILKCFLGKFYKGEDDEYPEEKEKLVQLGDTLEGYCCAITDHVTRTQQLDVISQTLTCLRSLNHANGPLQTKEEIAEKKAVDKTLQKAHDMLQNKKVVKSKKPASSGEEITMNTQFQTFCSNLLEFVRGKNTVAYQCGRTEKYLTVKEYFPTDVPLPKGIHFQKFVELINGPPAVDLKEKYARAKQVIEQLRVSNKLWPKTAPRDQQELDLKCLQILRALVYNKIVCLPKNWDDLFSSLSKSEVDGILMTIKRLQEAMDSYGIIEKVLPLMGRSNPDFGRQILQLMDMLLFNANNAIQTSVYKYFCDTREEAFFLFIKETLDKAIPAIKERKSAELQTVTKFKSSIKKKRRVQNGEEPTIALQDQHYIEDVEVILRVLAGLCDGQYKPMQDYFRVQPDNLKSINVVAKLTEYIRVVYTGISKNSIGLCALLVDTLHEICEGNPQNTEAMLNNKIVEYLNYLLRKTDFGSCTLHQVIELRLKIGVLLYAMIEENSQSETAKSVCKTVSVEYIKYVMAVCYTVTKVDFNGWTFIEGFESEKPQGPKLPKDGVKKIERIGFQYYIILETMCDISSKVRQTILNFKTPVEKTAYEYYSKACKSIEILKEDKLQKKHFRVHNENLVREEIKEVVKWGVDRSSPSSKLRSLLFYSQDILKDIEYQKKMQKYRILAIVAKNWTFWNYACIFLSLVINIFMLATWAAPGTLEDLQLAENATSLDEGGNHCVHCQKPSIMYLKENQYYIILYVLGSIHILCSTTLFACYLIIYHPTLPSLEYIKGLFSVSYRPMRKSKLEIHFISSTTLYYMMLVLFSVLGTIYYGYFFAFHLFGIIENNQLLRGVVKAVTLNGRSLIWVGILGFLILYIYTLIAFSSLRASMDIDEEVFCRTLAECFVSMIRYGTIGDYGEKWHLHKLNIDIGSFGYLTLFNVTFFIIFTIILLNIIFGIIVDTFSEIRDTKWVAEKDMKESCFICSRNSHDFEHFSKGFNHHVHKEHNMWAYVFYFIYVFEKERKDYTALDLHVANMFEELDDGLFPMNRAVSLTKPPEYTIENQVDDLIKTIVDMKKMHKTQGKTLVLMMEKIEEIEQALQKKMEDNETREAEMDQSKRLYLLADKWRKTARTEEESRRMSIFTVGTSSETDGQRPDAAEDIIDLVHDSKPQLEQDIDEESDVYESEDEEVPREEEEVEEEEQEKGEDDVSDTGSQ